MPGEITHFISSRISPFPRIGTNDNKKEKKGKKRRKKKMDEVN